MARQSALITAMLGLSVLSHWALGKNDQKQLPVAEMSEQKRAVHVLNRLAFGPRPGEVDRVMAMGVDRWIDQQLHPEKIDDSALEARLASLPTLRMSTREMVEDFPPQAVIKAIADGKQSLPSDPVKHAVYVAQLDKYEERLERKQEAAQTGNADAKVDSAKMAMAGTETEEDRRGAEDTWQALLELPPDQRFKAVLAMSSEQQRLLMSSLKNKADEFFAGLTPRQCESLKALNNPQQVVTEELVQGKLLRAVYSERQLQEVMTDFWLNHFNVFIGKGADRYELTGYERDVIRPHVFGKFENLLVAVAQSPAMLFYLDNWMSVGPNSDFANGIPKKKNGWHRPLNQSRKRGGLNENYGRELMELHTLGVNGGYTQKDVTEVARVFTGWTLEEPRQGGGFTFDERKHEPGDKIVLGHRIKSKGEKEGLQVLHILAHHPSTAKFICTKLATRFVSDDPPPQLVEQMARTFLKKDGDIREVLRTMLNSPQFWAEDQYRAKVKTPLEFVVSSVRASDAEITDAGALARQLQNMGMPLFGAQPPTGYSMKADAWVNSSALLGRMNFALALTAGKLKGTQVNADRLFGAEIPTDPEQTLASLENSLLADDVSKQTHDVISERLQDPKISRRKLDDPARAPNAGIVAGLLLGSPEFQRR